MSYSSAKSLKLYIQATDKVSEPRVPQNAEKLDDKKTPMLVVAQGRHIRYALSSVRREAELGREGKLKKATIG